MSAENNASFRASRPDIDPPLIEYSDLSGKLPKGAFQEEYTNSLDSWRKTGQTHPDLRSLSVPDLSIIEGGLHKTIEGSVPGGERNGTGGLIGKPRNQVFPDRPNIAMPDIKTDDLTIDTSSCHFDDDGPHMPCDPIMRPSGHSNEIGNQKETSIIPRIDPDEVDKMTTRPDYSTLDPMRGSPADPNAGKPVDSGKPEGAVNGVVNREGDGGVHTHK